MRVWDFTNHFHTRLCYHSLLLYCFIPSLFADYGQKIPAAYNDFRLSPLAFECPSHAFSRDFIERVFGDSRCTALGQGACLIKDNAVELASLLKCFPHL